MSETAMIKRENGGGPLIRPTDRLSDIQRLGNLLAASGYFSDAREMAQAAVKVMAGEELGIPAIASMTGVNIIKGKVSMGGNLLASRIRPHGYDYKVVKLDKVGCTIEFLSKIEDGKRRILGESSFTIEDAKEAGLLNSDNYRKFPRNMFFNRSISNGVKWFMPDITSGVPVYTPEELGATVDEEGNVVDVEPERETQEQVAARRIEEERAKLEAQRAAKREAPKEPPSPFQAMLASFVKAKAKIGSAHYYRILREKGYEHANEVPDIATGEILLQEMRDVAKAEKAFRATDQDLPEILQGAAQ